MNLPRYIIHTRLEATLTIRNIDQLVDDADQYSFLGICVPPFWVKRASREIGSRPITLVTVAGFPLGYNMTETKLDEIKRGIDNGADEVDVVLNLSSFKTGIPWTKIEIAKCSRLTHDRQKLLKVIIEAAYLTEKEIAEACRLCADAGVDFVKTSTGFGPTTATVQEVKLMRSVLPPGVGIEAAGPIQDPEQATLMIQAGADRIGTSCALNLIQSTLQPNPTHE